MNNDTLYVTTPSMPPFEEYCDAIRPLWQSKWITNMGELHHKFEKGLEQYLSVPQISLMVNGHMALELTIQAFDFKEGSKIITTPFTFVSTTHAIIRNHLRPVFCDIKKTNGTIDETKIEKFIDDKTVAILPVHTYGNVCNVEAIQDIADRYKLKVIYDAAHAFGVKYKGVGIGSFGDASIFSFHATKVFNSIEGGAVACNNDFLYDKLYNLKNFGIRGEESVVSVGANGKMNEFCAAMGLCNLKHISKAVEKRKVIYDSYEKLFRNIRGIDFFEEDKSVLKNFSYFPIIVKDSYHLSRDQLYNKFRKHDIYVRKYFFPLICDMDFYEKQMDKSNLENAKNISDRILVLPLYEDMKESDVIRVIHVLTS